MPKFTEMNNTKHILESKESEAFMDLLESLQDYIANKYYDEVADTPEKKEKIYNTIADLEAKFADYEATVDEHIANDYRQQMYEVIDNLEDFAKRG